MFALIALVIPLLTLWLALASLLSEGMALPLGVMRADHASADCVNQVSLAHDSAVAPDSEDARHCLKDHVQQGMTQTYRYDAKAHSISVPASTRCGLSIALCKLPQQHAQAVAPDDYRAIRYEKHHCELADQKASMLDHSPDSTDSPVQAFIGLVPLLNCDHPSPAVVDLSDWHCADFQHGVLRWWGAASRFSSPCLLSDTNIAEGTEAARPAIGRALKLRKSS